MKAVGYVAVLGEDEGQISELHNELEQVAKGENLDLVEIYVDRHASASLAGRPGFAKAIEVLYKDEMAVLLISWVNVSPIPSVQATAYLSLEEVAMQIFVSRPPAEDE